MATTDVSESVTPTSATSPAPHDEDDPHVIRESPSLDISGNPDSTDADMDMPLSGTINTPESPRCQSRESTESSSIALHRNDYGVVRGVPLPATALSPVLFALLDTLPPAAAAALFPPNSAAMAAYHGAAAAAAAQHLQRVMMTSHLPAFVRGTVSPLVTSSSSPPEMQHPMGWLPPSPTTAASMPIQSPLGGSDPAQLDFSTKKISGNLSKPETDGDAMNLSKPITPTPLTESNINSPLDLSLSSRKRIGEEPVSQPPAQKTRSSSDYKPLVLPPWPSPVSASHLPYFATASTLSPKTNHLENHGCSEAVLCNGKVKQVAPTPSDATKAVEKTRDSSKLGGEDLLRTMASSGASANSASSRSSPWPSHWLNKVAELTKDVLRCVWCKQRFPSLAAMTTHMKEAKHNEEHIWRSITESRRQTQEMRKKILPIPMLLELNRVQYEFKNGYTGSLVGSGNSGSYHHHQSQHSFSRRERSGSESTSVYERGSSRMDSLTTDRRMDPPVSHPLTALQKLCDKTEPAPVMTSNAFMKCAFCDTKFICIGAYRRHFSKMHFVAYGVIPDPLVLNVTPVGSSATAPAPGGYEESPHSKILKYTELAKQLSSKYE